jgi:SPOR domain
METMKLALAMLLLLAAEPAFAGPAVESEGPLSPCATPQAAPGSDAAQAHSEPSWGVEIATSFSKDEALAEFAKIKQDHASVLGSYDATVIETCDLHMGTKLQYSARISTDTRDEADALCAKLQNDGGACIVQKN